MKTSILKICFLLLLSIGVKAQTYELKNSYLSRTISTKPYLHTTQIVNKIINMPLDIQPSEEFILRLSQGTDKIGTDVWLTSKDFSVKKQQSYRTQNGDQGIKIALENKKYGIHVDVHYELQENQFYMYKYLNITSDRSTTLERVDMDVIYMEGAYQPYNKKAITAQASANWRPGLGQPVYNYVNASFWGVEFPAATNTVVDQKIKLGYLWGKNLEPAKMYTTYKSVMGVADNAAYIDDAFLDYIDAIRIRPFRLEVNYNCCFDLGNGVNEETFTETSQLVHKELVEKRGVKPLNAYVIDDGWQDVSLPDLAREDGVWSINHKFSRDFEHTHQILNSLGSNLGLWLSPGSFFGSRKQVDILRENGYEALSLSMSMAGSKYMDKLEKRILNLTRQGVGYFKFDGLFGHLNIRDFELNGRGVPVMPQLNTKGFSANDKRLNHPVYDELKIYYLVAGTERLMQMMKHQHAVNPHVFTAITNGAYLSPWWLQYTDAVWLINCGDAAGGGNRSEELIYRDGIYHDVFLEENTKFPIHSIWNHEPKKTSTGESAEEFRDYLFMHLSRGAGLIELYLRPKILSSSDWDIIAEGLKWAESMFPTFQKVKMYGGHPQQKQIYGYSGWNKQNGYISMHNPSNKPQVLNLVFNREIGVTKDVLNVTLSSPITGDTKGLKKQWSYGDTLSIELQPKEIRILTFK